MYDIVLSLDLLLSHVFENQIVEGVGLRLYAVSEVRLVVKSSAMTTEFDNNVISYNPDDDNKKVRIYAMPLAEWLTGFMDRLLDLRGLAGAGCAGRLCAGGYGNGKAGFQQR